MSPERSKEPNGLQARGTRGVRPEIAAREFARIESSAQKDAARALEMLHAHLVSTVIDPYCWRWVVSVQHHALHAFLVASADEEQAGPEPEARLEGGGDLDARYTGETEPARRDVPLLYARMCERTSYRPSADVDQAVARLCELEDVLFHRVPSRWSLQAATLPRTVRNTLRVIEYLGWNPGHVAWKKDHLADLARLKWMASVQVLDALERMTS